MRAIAVVLCCVADDSTRIADVGRRARTLLRSNGHANGAYIARAIYETFGVDSLFPAVTSPAAFLRTYASVETRRGAPAPFSAKALRVIDALERKYWARQPE